MSETKINVSQTTITAEDIGAASAFDTMPTASANTVGKIVQYTGNTTSSYTNGFFYKGVSDGQDPATYSWTQTDVQPQAGGLPDQTGQSGKFLITDGTNASWSNKPLVNAITGGTENIGIGVIPYPNRNTKANVLVGDGCSNGDGSYNGQGSGYNVGVGYYAGTQRFSVSVGASTWSQRSCVAIGYNAHANLESDSSVDNYIISIGANSKANAFHAIQIGSTGSVTTNSDANTFKVANQNGNFELMSADGTMPAARHATLPAADGTYTLQLVITNGVPTLSWVAV